MTSGYVVPMSSPDLTDAEIAAVNQVLATRYLSLGPQMKVFEQALPSYVGVRHAIGVNSGTRGLHLVVIGRYPLDGSGSVCYTGGMDYGYAVIAPTPATSE